MLVFASMLLASFRTEAAGQFTRLEHAADDLLFEPVGREATAAVATHASAQSKSSRMHCASC